MKRKTSFILLFILSITVFLFIISCSGTVGVTLTLETAKAQFITWCATQENSEDAVGTYCGTVQKGDVVGEEDPGSANIQQRQFQALTEGGWLFYYDENPGALYSHPGKIVSIGKSGKITLEEVTTGYPTVNGETVQVMKEHASFRMATPTIYNPREIYIPIAVMDIITLIPRVRICGAVITNGLTPGEILFYETDHVQDLMVDAFQGLIFEPDNVKDIDYYSVSSRGNAPTDVEAAIVDLRDNQVTDITLYYVAHGGDYHMSIGGSSFTCADLEALLNLYSSINFTVIIDTCHGGSWTDYFDSLTTPPENLDMLIASTSSDKSAYSDWDVAYEGGTRYDDFNAADDQFIEFSSDFILQMEYYTSTQNHWNTVIGLDPSIYNPVNNNSYLKLYYLCYMRTIDRNYVPGTPGGINPALQSNVLPQRTPFNAQSPQIYKIEN
ncbi:MAG: hypothetical protein U9N62_00410 [Thermotogota bacterium]|nr:hypothetical protein [Thermotogota bacterium]